MRDIIWKRMALEYKNRLRLEFKGVSGGEY